MSSKSDDTTNSNKKMKKRSIQYSIRDEESNSGSANAVFSEGLSSAKGSEKESNSRRANNDVVSDKITSSEFHGSESGSSDGKSSRSSVNSLLSSNYSSRSSILSSATSSNSHDAPSSDVVTSAAGPIRLSTSSAPSRVSAKPATSPTSTPPQRPKSAPESQLSSDISSEPRSSTYSYPSSTATFDSVNGLYDFRFMKKMSRHEQKLYAYKNPPSNEGDWDKMSNPTFKSAECKYVTSQVGAEVQSAIESLHTTSSSELTESQAYLESIAADGYRLPLAMMEESFNTGQQGKSADIVSNDVSGA